MENNTPTPQTEDKKSIGLNIVSFLFPVIGLIIYLVKKDKTPIKAKSAGKAAIAGFVIGAVISVTSRIALTAIANKAYEDIGNADLSALEEEYDLGDYDLGDYNLEEFSAEND